MKLYSIILTVTSIFCITPSFSQLKIKNSSGEIVYASIGYYDSGNWYAEGYWKINPGKTVVVHSKRLENRYYYFHAEGTTLVWEGSMPFYIDPADAFKLQQKSTRVTTHLSIKNFRQIDTGNEREYTLSLISHNGSSPVPVRPQSMWHDYHPGTLFK